MDIKDKYTEDTWGKIKRLPYMVAIGMEGAGRSGLSGSAQERHAAVVSVLSAREAFPGNPLISRILPLSDGEKAEMDVIAQHDSAMNFLSASGILSATDLWNHIEACAPEVLQALAKHEAGDTLTDYRQWLLRIASDVSVAAKEGDFFGIGGVLVSEEERECYARLERALDLESGEED